MRRSKKNYYKYRFTKKRKNNRKLIKFLIFLFFLFFLYSLPKVSNVVNKFFSNYFTIKDIEILENNTTVPDEIIIEFFLKNKVSLFNFKKLIKNLLKTYPEIKKVKINRPRLFWMKNLVVLKKIFW
jgi:cell division septal protein FtsQ